LLLALIAGAYVAVALSGRALAVTAAYGATQLAWTVGNDPRGLLLRHTLALDLSFHRTHPPGELIERTDGDVTALSTLVSSFVMRIVGSALTLSGKTTLSRLLLRLADPTEGVVRVGGTERCWRDGPPSSSPTGWRRWAAPMRSWCWSRAGSPSMAPAADPQSRFARLLASNQAVAA
jgi:ABC-type multidrug transport system fused ATPase/permease subunit